MDVGWPSCHTVPYKTSEFTMHKVFMTSRTWSLSISCNRRSWMVILTDLCWTEWNSDHNEICLPARVIPWATFFNFWNKKWLLNTFWSFNISVTRRIPVEFFWNESIWWFMQADFKAILSLFSCQLLESSVPCNLTSLPCLLVLPRKTSQENTQKRFEEHDAFAKGFFDRLMWRRHLSTNAVVILFLSRKWHRTCVWISEHCPCSYQSQFATKLKCSALFKLLELFTHGEQINTFDSISSHRTKNCVNAFCSQCRVHRNSQNSFGDRLERLTGNEWCVHICWFSFSHCEEVVQCPKVTELLPENSNFEKWNENPHQVWLLYGPQIPSSFRNLIHFPTIFSTGGLSETLLCLKSSPQRRLGIHPTFPTYEGQSKKKQLFLECTQPQKINHWKYDVAERLTPIIAPILHVLLGATSGPQSPPIHATSAHASGQWPTQDDRLLRDKRLLFFNTSSKTSGLSSHVPGSFLAIKFPV